MKKMISIALATVLCLSIALTVIVPTGADAPSNPLNELFKTYDVAANGDLLYKVQFGVEYGVYKSHEIIRDSKNLGTFTVSEDGYSVKYELPDKSSTGKWWFGDSIDGLELGADKQYTITYKIKNDNRENMGTGNNGFFFSTNVDGSDYQHSYGAYGNLSDPDGAFYSLFRVGKKITGEWNGYCDPNTYIKLTGAEGDTFPVPTIDADGFCECSIEIDGYKYYMYYNGHLLEYATIPEADYSESNNLAAIFYTYSSGGELKDVEVYKGLTKTVPAVDTTTEEGGTTKDPYAEEFPDDTPTAAVTTTEAPVDNTTTAAPNDAGTTAAPVEDNSCGGIGVAVQAIMILGSAITVIVFRKKH